MLEVYRSNDSNTLPQHRVRDLKRLTLKQVQEIHNPPSMARNLLKRLLDKRLRHRVAEVAQPHRQQERVVQQARDRGIHELQEQPGAPVGPLLVQLGGLAVLEVVLAPAVFCGDAAVDVEVPRHDVRVVRVGFPGGRGLGVCWAGGVAACHVPDLGELVCED